MRWLRNILQNGLRRALLRFVVAGVVLVLGGRQIWAWYQFHLAQSALVAYHPEEARTALASCLRVWANDTETRLIASRAARQGGDFQSADDQLRQAQRLAGGSTDEIAFEWALLQAAAGNVREVEEYLQNRVEKDPRLVPLVWEALIEGYLRVYRTIDAMATVEQWLRNEPDNVRALELRGITFVVGKGVKRGADDFRRVIEKDPNRIDTRLRLVRCLLDLGSYGEALTHLEWLVRTRPDEPDLKAQMGRCLIVLDRRDEARRLLDDTTAKYPEHGLALRTRGQLALVEEQRDVAETWLRRAAVAWPEDYQTQYLLAQALLLQGKVDAGQSQMRLANDVKDRAERVGELRSRKLAEQPLDPALHYEMGTLLIRTGYPEVGVQWLHSAVSLDPGFTLAHGALADYYERIGDPARAADHRRQATPK